MTNALNLISPFYYTGGTTPNSQNGTQGIKRFPGSAKDDVLTGIDGKLVSPG